MRLKSVAFIFTLLFFTFSLNAKSKKDKSIPEEKFSELEYLKVFQESYPDIKFLASYDKEKNDWLIHVITRNNQKEKPTETKLYWCEGRFLPEDQLQNKDNYRKMLYKYQREVSDPKDFTQEQIDLIKQFTSKENRSNGAIDPPFLYNAIYDCETQLSTEQHIKKVDFLNKSVNVHERIEKAVERVSKKIYELPRDEEMQNFLSTLTRTDGYVWRNVRDTQSRSFHSVGLAVDVLPRGYYQKIIYWGWQKQLYPDDWYMTPLEKRWMPPQRVIDIFWQEGFIWGGTWAVWDNMHFEYKPELINFAKKETMY